MVRNILVVDDDEDDREFFLQIMEEFYPGMNCVTAVNGHDALEKLRGYQPDVIFLDLNMPLMNGFQFLEKLLQRNELRGTPVLILSTSSDPKSIQDAIQCGAKDFITKPDTLSGWEVALKKALNSL
jgi:CheY-like chemotaxis protein